MSNLIQERPITIYTLLFAFIITTILVGVITAIGEIVTINGENVVQNWLEYTYGNHWVGGGIWTIIFFISFSFIGYISLKLKSKEVPVTLVRVAGHVTLLTSVILILILVYGYLFR